MGGEFGIRPVDPRIVEVRPVDTGLQVVRHQPGRATLKEPERLDMTVTPGGLVHPDDRADEDQPRARQHHDERLDGVAGLGGRVRPRPQPAVIDLRLTARLDRPSRHRHPTPGSLLGQVRRDPPPHPGLRCRPPPLRGDPGTVRRGCDLVRQLRNDVVPVHLDRRPCHLPQPGIGQPREPPRDPLRPNQLTGRRAARHQPLGQRRGQELPHRLPVQIQALADLHLRPPGLPMHEQLGQIHHVESPPAHHRSRPGHQAAGGQRDPRAGPTRRRRTVVPMGNYVTNQGGELRDGHPSQPGELHDR